MFKNNLQVVKDLLDAKRQRQQGKISLDQVNTDGFDSYKKGGIVVKKMKQKQKQKQSQQTKINIRIGDTSKKRKSKSRKPSEKKEKTETKIQFVPQYIQSSPMITSDTMRSSLQPVNLSEALNKKLGEFEQKINQGIPLQNVEELSSLINQGIQAASRLTRPPRTDISRPPPMMRPESVSSTGSIYEYNLPDLEEENNMSFSSSSLMPYRLPEVPEEKYPIEEQPQVSAPLALDFVQVAPNYIFRPPLGDIAPLADLPNQPINLPPIEEVKQEENYPIVAGDFIKFNEPEQEIFQTGNKVKKDKPFLNTGYKFKGSDVYLSKKNNIYMFNSNEEFGPANTVLTPKDFRKLQRYINSENLKFE